MGARLIRDVTARIIVTFTSRLSPSIFHTVSDKNLTRGKAGYEATLKGCTWLFS